MWITITISRSVISDGLLWPRCRHTHSAMRLCGPVLLTCSSCFLCSLLYTFHAERPRHRLEADTTWNTTHQIKCSHHTGFDHSSVLLYYNAEHYQLTCTFLNLLILTLGTVQILRPCMHSEVHFRVHKILPMNHILNHLNQVHNYTFCLQDLFWCQPSMYVFSVL